MTLAVGVSLLLAACGGSDGTTYWEANFTNGTKEYLSLTVSNGNASGWAQYGDGSFQAFNGQTNSDGTLDVTAYGGSTLSINGSSMTDDLQSGEGNVHFVKVSGSAYKEAGGPG